METIMLIKRMLENLIKKRLFKGKAILIYGPRQSGKTTLVKQVMKDSGKASMLLNGDEPDVRELLNGINSTRMKAVFGKNKLIVIDEAQMIPGIGLTLKLITDQLKDTQVIATGSSSFELAGHTKEPLTGRKYEYFLYPFSFSEMADFTGLLEERRMLKHRLVFGAYPEIVIRQGEEKELLKLLAGSYLYKDILMLEGIKKPALLDKILRALALQVGSEVSFNELGQLAGADSKTIEKYIDILQRASVVFQLPAFSRNVRNEIRKGRKIYFHDNGIRNAVIGNFSSVESRTDVGALWENYLMSERFKILSLKMESHVSYFWRTTQQQEIDYLEEREGHIHAWEFKWNPAAKIKVAKTFRDAYPDTVISSVTPKNYDEFLLV